MSIFEPRLVGTADADGDGSSEVFVVLESGNDGASVGIYVLDDDLKLLSWSENPLIFSVANALNFRGGLTCEADGALRVVEASRSEDDTFAVSSETYRWRSASSLEPRAASEVRTGAAEQDDEVKKADGIHCRGLEWRF
jgi:hypothetical protein